MKNYIRQFEYELWANELTINSIKTAMNPEERAYNLIGHIVASHSIWLDKILHPIQHSMKKKVIFNGWLKIK